MKVVIAKCEFIILRFACHSTGGDFVHKVMFHTKHTIDFDVLKYWWNINLIPLGYQLLIDLKQIHTQSTYMYFDRVFATFMPVVILIKQANN